MSDLLALFTLYPTVRYAALSVILASVSAALLGVILVLKRYSMIGDGLSHVAFGTTAIATVLGLTTPTYVTLSLTIISAVLILRLKKSSKIGGDSAIAMISAASLAFGYLLLNLLQPSEANAAGDACTTLFGSGIIGIGKSDVTLCICLTAIVLTVYVLFHNKIFSITFDEDFASATGTRAEVYNTFIAIIAATVIVVTMNTMGALLASALITFPALSSMRLFKTFKKVTIAAAIISASCALIGTVISLAFAMPIGPTVVAANLVFFILSCVFSMIKSK